MPHNSGMAGGEASIAKSKEETEWIAERARALGFALCGVVRAESFPELARAEEWLTRTEEWLARGYAGEMAYLKDARRGDLPAVLPGVRSVIVCALNYNSAAARTAEALESDAAKERGWISRYAWGRDYHEVLREKLDALAETMRERFGEAHETRRYCDTGPVNERVLAKYAGLGWLGKNTLLLNRELGSWFFLGVILTTLELTPSVAPGEAPPADFCGTCTRCIEACPTDALVEPYVLDARRCISYLTIELRGSIAEELREAMGRHVFGCDICQDVCPWNRRAPVTAAEEFQPRTFSSKEEWCGESGDGESGGMSGEETRSREVSGGAREREAGGALRAEPEQVGLCATGDGEEKLGESLFLPRLVWLAALSEEEFREYFRGSAMKRTKRRGLVRNACIALGNAARAGDAGQRREMRGVLARLASSAEPVVAESAQWALSRIE